MAGRQSDLAYGVLVPAFNAARTLEAALDSLLAQTCPPVEVVVVDDGSTDDTAAIATRFGEPVQVLSQSNLGPAAATDRAFAALTTPIFAGLDADDLWRPEKAERQLEVLAARADIDAVFCRAGIFLHGETPGGTDRAQDLWGRSAMMMRSSAAHRIGPVLAAEGSTALGEMIRWLDHGRRLGLAFHMMSATLVDRRIISGSLSYGQGATGLLPMVRERLERRTRSGAGPHAEPDYASTTLPPSGTPSRK